MFCERTLRQLLKLVDIEAAVIKSIYSCWQEEGHEASKFMTKAGVLLLLSDNYFYYIQGKFDQKGKGIATVKIYNAEPTFEQMDPKWGTLFSKSWYCGWTMEDLLANNRYYNHALLEITDDRELDDTLRERPSLRHSR